MFKIMDLLSGKTLIDHVDDDYINMILPEVCQIQHEHGIPEYCWLS